MYLNIRSLAISLYLSLGCVSYQTWGLWSFIKDLHGQPVFSKLANKHAFSATLSQSQFPPLRVLSCYILNICCLNPLVVIKRVIFSCKLSNLFEAFGYFTFTFILQIVTSNFIVDKIGRNIFLHSSNSSKQLK